MKPQNDKPAIYEDEIGLYDFWKNILKKKRLLLGMFIVSIIIAAVISLTMPKIYRGEVTMRIVIKENEKETITANDLVDIIGKVDREKIMIIFPEKSDMIDSLKINQLPGSTDKFKVSVELKDAIYFQDLIKDFVEYMNGIPIIKKLVEQQSEMLSKRLQEMDNIIGKSQRDAESFQKMIVREKLNPIGFNPVDFNQAVSELKIKKIALQQSIKNLSGVEIMAKPIVFKKPVKPRPLLYILIAGLTSVVAGIFLISLLTYLENNRILRED